MKQKFSSFYPAPGKATWRISLFHYARVCCIFMCALFSSAAMAQTFPPETSCSSGDLLLVGATLPPNAGEDACGTCTAGSTITRTLFLAINNKTGSTRTSFAFWGTLEIINPDGTIYSTEQLNRCRGPIVKNSINTVNFGTLSYPCGKSLRLTNLYLAWTSASPGETCPVLTGSPSTINPKCGTLPLIQIVAGLDASMVVTDATCTTGGSIAVSPFGGRAPYSVTVNGITRSVAAVATTTFTNLPAANYPISITDATTPTACSTSKSRTVGSSSAPSVSAGSAFTKTCTSNTTGATIGEANDASASYSWSPAAGLSSPTVSNPTANPTTTTTYTVTKTTTANGCSSQASVIVTVDNMAPNVTGIGGAFSKTCTSNSSGATIGETPVAGFSYAWSPSAGLSNDAIGNPTANPSTTTTYTVTKTNTANGCTAQASVEVTVNTTVPSVIGIGGAFTKTCTANTTGATIGETPVAGFSYAWSPSGGLSNAAIGNPTANPSSTTTYTVTKTNTANGCTAQASVEVTVNTTVPSVTGIGGAFTKTCTANTTGATIGETPVAGFSYAWLPTAGLSNAAIGNPTASPSATTNYTVTKTNIANGCPAEASVEVTVNTTVPSVAGIGGAFTKTCTSNTPGATIGETPVAGFSYAWSPAAGLSNAAIGNPTANPSSTTTYTVTKTNTANGCTAQASVEVTVSATTPSVSGIGGAFTKTCTSNTSGATIGETPVAGFSYEWSPVTGLSNVAIGNPTANPSTTTTYTVTKTNTANGCTAQASVEVTVNTIKPAAPTFCAVEPALCGPSTGSLTIRTPLGSEYNYTVNDGTNWQAGTSFTSLAAGTVTGIKVKNINTGCISDAADCSSSDCSSALKTVTKTETVTDEEAVKAFVSPTKEESVSVKGMETITAKLDSKTLALAGPNPFSDRIRFVLQSASSGKGSLEIYNMLGQKVKTVFEGYVQAGKTRNIEYNVPASQRTNLTWVFTVGDQKVSGKLIGLK